MVSGATYRSSSQSAQEKDEGGAEDDKHKLTKKTSGFQQMVGRDSLAS